MSPESSDDGTGPGRWSLPARINMGISLGMRDESLKHGDRLGAVKGFPVACGSVEPSMGSIFPKQALNTDSEE
jgi:hypothetical protein